jgi:hypothetical protein
MGKSQVFQGFFLYQVIFVTNMFPFPKSTLKISTYFGGGADSPLRRVILHIFGHKKLVGLKTTHFLKKCLFTNSLR